MTLARVTLFRVRALLQQREVNRERFFHPLEHEALQGRAGQRLVLEPLEVFRHALVAGDLERSERD